MDRWIGTAPRRQSRENGSRPKLVGIQEVPAESLSAGLRLFVAVLKDQGNLKIFRNLSGYAAEGRFGEVDVFGALRMR